ncbi:response regulator [Pseudomonas alliivorans]|uniref:Response regulator n=1 Tax=Pseudomonas alliivorans TaxID=2810613 RepID=A0ABS4C757_9PSED|nr:MULTISPECIES: response regulator [Pseudomonas]MBP0942631.1 response regulator [Pseudomonas alliivorans]MBP0946493.1 response regulator [Pseudomonas alliivorans]MBP0949634.1 response regulator [Pseudomonas alliivorans]MCO5366039.1 response regulator [Pseudomonas alliivorans]MEE4309762.1 response regulator [Pseudomonas alliivorans]
MSKHSLRILLVEDHPFQLIATQILLNNQGYFLLTPVLTAAEAMAAMERSPEPYDLILCDQGLPDLEGFDLVEQAWQRGLIRHAVLLSGLPAQQLLDLEQRAIQRGLPMLGCLSKPLDGPDLVNLLNDAPGSR